jgi:hypothetical protein
MPNELNAPPETSPLQQLDAQLADLRNMVALVNGSIEKIITTTPDDVLICFEEQVNPLKGNKALPYLHMHVTVKL